MSSRLQRPLVCSPRRILTRVPPQRNIMVSAYPFEQEISLIGKSIVAFVFFYTSLNWFYYKRTREDLEDFYASNAKEIKPTKKEDTEKKK